MRGRRRCNQDSFVLNYVLKLSSTGNCARGLRVAAFFCDFFMKEEERRRVIPECYNYRLYSESIRIFFRVVLDERQECG